MNKLAFKIALIVFLIAGCKKYPDGGKSFLMKSRMYGTYTLESEIINGVDSTQQMRALCNNTIAITTGEEGKGEDWKNLIQEGTKGNFILDDKNRVIRYSLYSGTNGLNSIFRRTFMVLDIKRFKRGEFWLETQGSKYLLVKLKRVK
ncbi:MAG: hypothetical protein ACHQF2_07210 [Flavobacteriales bacterium]